MLEPIVIAGLEIVNVSMIGLAAKTCVGKTAQANKAIRPRIGGRDRPQPFIPKRKLSTRLKNIKFRVKSLGADTGILSVCHADFDSPRIFTLSEYVVRSAFIYPRTPAPSVRRVCSSSAQQTGKCHDSQSTREEISGGATTAATT
jgi:hypothetical protein